MERRAVSLQARLTEIGGVGGWRYIVVRIGNRFEVLRQDKFDQVEESLDLAPTLQSAIRKGTAAMIRDIRIKTELAKQNGCAQKRGKEPSKSGQHNVTK
jgi:hypothetical protein